METRRNYSLTETIVGIVLLIFAVWAAIFLFKSIFKILAWATPVLFILALIINYKVVLSYGKLLIGLLQKNLLVGLGAVLLTFFAFPIVAAALLGLAVMNKKADNFMKSEREKREGILTDYKEWDK